MGKKTKKMLRAARHKAMLLEERNERHKREFEEAGGNLAAIRAERAMSLPAIKDDLVMKPEPKADAIHKVVNHAHQRSPSNKWS